MTIASQPALSLQSWEYSIIDLLFLLLQLFFGTVLKKKIQQKLTDYNGMYQLMLEKVTPLPGIL